MDSAGASAFQLRLWGPPLLQGPAGPWISTSPQIQALLWYLASHHGQTFSRSYVGQLLWADKPEEMARRSFSTALWRLRQELPVWPLAVNAQTVCWRADAVWVDIHAFTHLAQGGDATALTEACWLRRGPFLHGFSLPRAPQFEDWVTAERTHLDQAWLKTLRRLLAVHAAEGDWQAVIESVRTALRVEPLDEALHRHLMQAQFHLGNRAGALTQFAELRRLLETELGVEPDPETMQFRAAIADGTLRRYR